MIVMGILKVVTKILGSSVLRNIKSKVGGAGNVNKQAILSDSAIDIIKYGALVALVVYALITGDWTGAEKGKDFINI